jgi:hypothetical protein
VVVSAVDEGLNPVTALMFQRGEVKPGDELLFAFEEKVTLSEARRTGIAKV